MEAGLQMVRFLFSLFPLRSNEGKHPPPPTTRLTSAAARVSKGDVTWLCGPAGIPSRMGWKHILENQQRH